MSHIKVAFVCHISQIDLLARPLPQLHLTNDIYCIAKVGCWS